MTIIVGGGVEEEGEEDDFVPTVSLTLYETDFDQFVNNLELLNYMWFYVFIKFKLLAFDVGDYYDNIIMQAEIRLSIHHPVRFLDWLLD